MFSTSTGKKDAFVWHISSTHIFTDICISIHTFYNSAAERFFTIDSIWINMKFKCKLIPNYDQ